MMIATREHSRIKSLNDARAIIKPTFRARVGPRARIKTIRARSMLHLHTDDFFLNSACDMHMARQI